MPCFSIAFGGGLGGHAAGDPVVLQRGDEGGAGADGDAAEVLGGQVVAGGEVDGELIGARADVGDAHALALPVRRGGDAGGLAAHLPFPGRPAELDHVDDVLALGLEVDGVHVPGAGHVDLPGDHRGLGADAARLLGRELHVDAVLLVEAQVLGELVGQVDLLVDAADHQCHGRHAGTVAHGGGIGSAGRRTARAAAGRQARREGRDAGHARDLGKGTSGHLVTPACIGGCGELWV